MAIAAQLKQQAMDAVSHSETIDQMRSYQNSGIEASPEGLFTHAKEPEPEVRPIPDDVKQQAMDSLTHDETSKQIRLVKDSGEVTPGASPSWGTDHIAGKIAAMHREGQDVDVTQKTITQDGFGRE